MCVGGGGSGSRAIVPRSEFAHFRYIYLKIQTSPYFIMVRYVKGRKGRRKNAQKFTCINVTCEVI